jgi:hypothetical protein
MLNVHIEDGVILPGGRARDCTNAALSDADQEPDRLLPDCSHRLECDGSNNTAEVRDRRDDSCQAPSEDWRSTTSTTVSRQDVHVLHAECKTNAC